MEQIGNYFIKQILGKGGMGVVYKAQHQQSNEYVALKTVIGIQENILQGIRQEILGLSKLVHPGIVPILDHGVHEGIPWYCMELLEGATLRQYLSPPKRTGRRVKRSDDGESESLDNTIPLMENDTGSNDTIYSISRTARTQVNVQYPMSEQTHSEAVEAQTKAEIDFSLFLSIIYKLCDSLAYLHGEGYVHRDLKPDNIWIKPDFTPLLMDFGLLYRFTGKNSRRDMLIVDGGSVGTISYMSPEQIKGTQIDARADLYALGCVLYEIFTGHPPFISPVVRQIVQAHVYSSPIPPVKFNPNLPDKLNQLILDLLEKEPHQRIGYADLVARKLRGIETNREHALPLSAKSYFYKSKFIGHADILEHMKSARENLLNRESFFLCVEGESGTGKTRLGIEIAHLALDSDIFVLTGETLENEDRPLSIFSKFFVHLLDRCREKGETETERLLGEKAHIFHLYDTEFTTLPGYEKQAKPALLQGPAAQQRLFHYLFEVVSMLAAEQPLLFIFDDVQWADELSLGALLQIYRSMGTQTCPLGIICLYRIEEKSVLLSSFLQKTKAPCIKLGSMSDAEISKMVAGMLCIVDVPTFLEKIIKRHAEGNPFFVAEYLMMLVQEGFLQRSDTGHWNIMSSQNNIEDLPAPETITELTLRKLDGLSNQTNRLLQHLSCLGRETPLSLLTEIYTENDETLFELLHQLEIKHIIEINDYRNIKITYDKLRATVYDSLPMPLKQTIHEQAAIIIESRCFDSLTNHYATLAHHCEMANMVEKSLQYFLLAARQAKDRYSYSEAETYYLKYLSLVENPNSESIKARNELVDSVYFIQGRMKEAEFHLKIAIQEAHSINALLERAISMVSLGNVYLRTNRFDEAKPHFFEALGVFNTLASPLDKAKTLGNIATLFLDMHEFPKALEYYHQTLEILDIQDDQRMRGLTLGNMGNVHFELGNLKEALELYRKAEKCFQQTDDLRFEGWILDHIAQVSLELGNSAEVDELYQKALTIHRKVGYKRNEAQTLAKYAAYLEEQDQSDQAISMYRQAVQICDETADFQFKGWILANMLTHYKNKKDYKRAIILADEALCIAKKLGIKLLEAYTYGNKASILEAQGILADSMKMLENSLELNRKINDLRLIGYELTLLARIKRRMGTPLPEVKILCSEGENILKQVGDPLPIIENFIEQGFIAIAEGRSAESIIRGSRDQIQEIGPRAEKRLNDRLHRLEKAQTLFENATYEFLYAGEAQDELPEPIKQWLKNKGIL